VLEYQTPQTRTKQINEIPIESVIWEDAKGNTMTKSNEGLVVVLCRKRKKTWAPTITSETTKLKQYAITSDFPTKVEVERVYIYRRTFTEFVDRQRWWAIKPGTTANLKTLVKICHPNLCYGMQFKTHITMQSSNSSQFPSWNIPPKYLPRR